jgi:hypothetical protein
MTATVRITVEEAGPVLKVPMAALRFLALGEFARRRRGQRGTRRSD